LFECEELPGLWYWLFRLDEDWPACSSPGKTSAIGGNLLLVWFAGTWWMCEVWERFEGWLMICRVIGCMW
jgi:hypothetical protein